MIPYDLRQYTESELVHLLNRLEREREITKSRGAKNAIDCLRDRAAAALERRRKGNGVKLSVKRVCSILTRIKAGERRQQIAASEGVSASMVSHIDKGRSWRSTRDDFLRRLAKNGHL